MSETHSGYSQRLRERQNAGVSSAGLAETLTDGRTLFERTRALVERALTPHHALLAAIVALSAVLNTWRLSQNGYANIFYSAGVRSMLDSLHNFLFVSFDPGGLVTIDKPPLGVWVQAASAKLFGFGSLSLILPEAIMGTVSVAVLYRIVARRLGQGAGLASALALAVFPSFVAVSRENGVDPLLILLMILACGACLAAIENGRLRSLLWSAVLVGLAFNTKTLAAWLVLPSLTLGYLVCASGSLRTRLVRLLAAGIVMGIVSFAWIGLIEFVPASQRPYVGSSRSNSEVGLTFKYNGFGRVQGEQGGPGRIIHAQHQPISHIKARSSTVNAHNAHTPAHGLGAGHSSAAVRVAAVSAKPPPPAILPNGRERSPIPFGGPVGLLRLFDRDLGDQDAWLLPLALAGLIALAVSVLERPRRRADPRLAVLIVLGGWLLVEAIVLSFSKGIVHPYYVSAIGPGAAAMIGAGAFSFAGFTRRRDWRLVLPVGAISSSVAVQVVLLDQQRYMQWFIPPLIGLAALGLVAMIARRLVRTALTMSLCLLSVAPVAYSATTWLAPVEGTLPEAGPRHAAGEGKLGLSPTVMHMDKQLMAYVEAHRPTARWSLLTEASITAAPFILLEMHAGALAGYSATDPVLDGSGLARLVRHLEARYVLLGGAYSLRGGNSATAAVARACRPIPTAKWRAGATTSDGLVLFDCAGREAALSGARI